MAVKKTASSTKAKDAAAPKAKAVGAKGAAKGAAAAPKKAAAAAPKKATAAAAPKKAAPKKAAPAVKLTSTQTDLLQKIHGSGESGYHADKKGEHRSIEALRERKLVKRGPKNKESGHYHYLISNAGKKHVGASTAGASGSAGAGSASSSAAPTPGGNA